MDRDLNPISVALREKLVSWKRLTWLDDGFVLDAEDPEDGFNNWICRGQLGSLQLVVSSANDDTAVSSGMLIMSYADEHLFINYESQLMKAGWSTNKGGELSAMLTNPHLRTFLNHMNGATEDQLARSLFAQLAADAFDKRIYVEDPVLLDVGFALLGLMDPLEIDKGSP